MRIRIEHETPEGETLNSCNVKVVNEESGKVLGGVQRLNIIYDAYHKTPKAYLEVINFNALLRDIEVADISVVAFGPHHKTIENMSREELIEALKREAALRYKESYVAISPFSKEK